MAHFRLLEAFADAFTEKPYFHRNQTIGNFIAVHLFDDLIDLGRSAKLVERVAARRCVVNTANLIKGRRGRRGDGTLGDLIPGETPEAETGFLVPRGPVATILVGAEVKILAKSMIRQVDRVINDLAKQAAVFKRQTPQAITVAIVGVNCADSYTSYEGERRYPAKPTPAQEAPRAIGRLEREAVGAFDEFLFLRFRATNVEPYPFEWVDERETRQSYGAGLLRISDLFDKRS